MPREVPTAGTGDSRLTLVALILRQDVYQPDLEGLHLS